MTTTPGNASSNLPGKPPIVDLATWQAAREELLIREKAHTDESDAIAAARRRLPMVELDGAGGPTSSAVTCANVVVRTTADLMERLHTHVRAGWGGQKLTGAKRHEHAAF